MAYINKSPKTFEESLAVHYYQDERRKKNVYINFTYYLAAFSHLNSIECGGYIRGAWPPLEFSLVLTKIDSIDYSGVLRYCGKLVSTVREKHEKA